MLLRPRAYIEYQLRYFGAWEPAETAAMQRFIPRDATVLDIGANVGYHTLLAARLVGEGGRVLSLEPEPETYDMLEANVRLNGMSQVEAVPAAAGSCEAKLPLFYHRTDPGSNSLLPGQDMKEGQAVDVLTIDNLLESRKVKQVDFVKIDAEGWEPHVFRGARALLERERRPILMFEINTALLRRAGCSTDDLLAPLTYCERSTKRH
jgi:FkbM family methyltransferase